MATDDEEWTDDDMTDADPDYVRLRGSVMRGDVAGVRQLLDAGVDVNAKNRYGETLLFYGDVAVVQLLVERGADVHAKAEAGGTALHAAA